MALVPGRGVTVGGTGVALLVAATAAVVAEDVLVRLAAGAAAVLTAVLACAVVVVVTALVAAAEIVAVVALTAPPQALKARAVPAPRTPSSSARRVQHEGDRGVSPAVLDWIIVTVLLFSLPKLLLLSLLLRECRDSAEQSPSGAAWTIDPATEHGRAWSGVVKPAMLPY